MELLNCVETSIQNQNELESKNQLFSLFLIEPLQTGQGITLGNSLRRTLLSDLTGFAITGTRINNLHHEFSIIEGVREDVLEILLNLKEIVFKPSLKIKNQFISTPLKIKGILNIQGPIIVTAGMFFLPKETFQIINPEQYICTVLDNSKFYMEIDIENGVGYKLVEETRKKYFQENFLINKPSTLLVDALFSPIKRVNFKIKIIHDSYGNLKESLALEILTNGSISPKRSLQEANKILMDLFYSLFVNQNFLELSNHLISLDKLKKQEKQE